MPLQRPLTVQLPDTSPVGPLHLRIDGAEIEARGIGEWNARRYGRAKRPARRKAHLIIEEGGTDQETIRGDRSPDGRGRSFGQ